MVQFSCTNFGRCVKLLMKTQFVDPTGVFHWVDQRTIKGGVGGGGVFVNVMAVTKGHTLHFEQNLVGWTIQCMYHMVFNPHVRGGCLPMLWLWPRETLSRLLILIPLCALPQSTQSGMMSTLTLEHERSVYIVHADMYKTQLGAILWMLLWSGFEGSHPVLVYTTLIPVLICFCANNMCMLVQTICILVQNNNVYKNKQYAYMRKQ